LQIRFEILEYRCYNSGPRPRTHVWRKATTMSYDDFQKHLAYLKERGLVGEDAHSLFLYMVPGSNTVGAHR